MLVERWIRYNYLPLAFAFGSRLWANGLARGGFLFSRTHVKGQGRSRWRRMGMGCSLPSLVNVRRKG